MQCILATHRGSSVDADLPSLQAPEDPGWMPLMYLTRGLVTVPLSYLGRLSQRSSSTFPHEQRITNSNHIFNELIFG